MTSVAFSHDGTRLASASHDGTVRVWDLREGAPWLVLHHVAGGGLARSRRGFFAMQPPLRLVQAVVVRSEARAAAVEASAVPDAIPGLVARLFVRAKPSAAAKKAPDRPAPAPASAEFYRPLGPLERLFHSPERFAADLRGEVTDADMLRWLAELGLPPPEPWDGSPVVLHDPPARAPEAAGAPAPASRAAPAPPPTNPFTTLRKLQADHPPPGRAEMAEDLLKHLRADQSAVLLGPRRSGKTSLFRHLAHRLAPTHTVLEVDLQGVPCQTPDRLAAAILPDLAREKSPAGALVAALRALSKPPVLVLDELGNLARVALDADPNVFGWLRSLRQVGIPTVHAGTVGDWRVVLEHDRKRPGSSFPNDLRIFRLGPLTEADALDLVSGRAPADVPIPREGAAARVLARCGGWPYYLLTVAEALVDEARRGRRGPLVRPEELDALYERVLLGDQGQLFHEIWTQLPGAARHAIGPGLPDDPPNPARLAPATRTLLNDYELVHCEGAAWRWRLAENPPFCDWMRRNAGILKAASDERSEA